MFHMPAALACRAQGTQRFRGILTIGVGCGLRLGVEVALWLTSDPKCSFHVDPAPCHTAAKATHQSCVESIRRQVAVVMGGHVGPHSPQLWEYPVTHVVNMSDLKMSRFLGHSGRRC